MASPRRQSSAINAVIASNQPSPEVRKFEQKLRRKEAKQDENMSRLNAQLQAMIREGQQALGSKIEVQEFTDIEPIIDEGYEEGFHAEPVYITSDEPAEKWS
jgi:flagellar biosynthesis/type III secretory pathway protein FliH